MRGRAKPSQAEKALQLQRVQCFDDTSGGSYNDRVTTRAFSGLVTLSAMGAIRLRRG